MWFLYRIINLDAEMHILTRNKVNIFYVPNSVFVGPTASVEFGSFINRFIFCDYLSSLSVSSILVNFQKALKICRIS